MLIWEEIKWSQDGVDVLPSRSSILRSRVPGGWLVLVLAEGDGQDNPSLTFYPDPSYKWDGSSVRD